MGVTGDLTPGHPYENDNPVDELVTVHAPIALVKDKSDLGNDATQSDSAKQPGHVVAGQNSLPLINFDGMNDVLEFDEIDPIYTVLMVVDGLRKPRFHSRSFNPL